MSWCKNVCSSLALLPMIISSPGVHLISGKTFNCLFENAKKSFYCAQCIQWCIQESRPSCIREYGGRTFDKEMFTCLILWDTSLPNVACTDKVVEPCSNLQFQENLLMFVVRTLTAAECTNMFDCCQVNDVIVKRKMKFLLRYAPYVTVLSVWHVMSIWLVRNLSHTVRKSAYVHVFSYGIMLF